MIETMMSKYIRKPVPVPLEVRGLAPTPLDDNDLDPETDFLTRSYLANLQRAACESQTNTPCSSGRSSPTITEHHTESPYSISQGGWTERSSLDSTYSLDDFDKAAAHTVHQHFEDIEAVLFEPLDPLSTSAQHTTHHTPHNTPPADVVRECGEWSSQFPHLRILGHNTCPSLDAGYVHIPPSPHTTPRGSIPGSSRLTHDPGDGEHSSLTILGHSVSAYHAPVESLSMHSRDSTENSKYAFLYEEVIEQDGLYEDVIAVDAKNIYEDNLEFKKQITPRRRRVGYPPITPNACVKDSVTSAAFDHIWQEIMSWMRDLLQRYTTEIADSRNGVISMSLLNRFQPTPMSREISTLSHQRLIIHRSHTHLGSSTDRSLDNLLHVSTKPLQNRNPMDPSESPVLLTAPRPGSSFQATNLRGARGRRALAPIGHKGMEEERALSRGVTSDSLHVQGVPMSGSDALPSPPSNFQRNTALPPLDAAPQQSSPDRRQQGYRATSAIDNKDMRLSLFRNHRSHMATEQARPNTTHAMRSETPLGAQGRRSSTPLGSSILARNQMLLSRVPGSLDVRGSSLQPDGSHYPHDSHFPPDILEDQEGPAQEEVIRTHWNRSPITQNQYRRSTNRLSTK